MNILTIIGQKGDICVALKSGHPTVENNEILPLTD